MKGIKKVKAKKKEDNRNEHKCQYVLTRKRNFTKECQSLYAVFFSKNFNVLNRCVNYLSLIQDNFILSFIFCVWLWLWRALISAHCAHSTISWAKQAPLSLVLPFNNHVVSHWVAKEDYSYCKSWGPSQSLTSLPRLDSWASYFLASVTLTGYDSDSDRFEHLFVYPPVDSAFI